MLCIRAPPFVLLKDRSSSHKTAFRYERKAVFLLLEDLRLFTRFQGIIPRSFTEKHACLSIIHPSSDPARQYVALARNCLPGLCAHTRRNSAMNTTPPFTPIAPLSLTLALPRQFVGVVSALAWSPDGRRLAAASSCGSVAVWETHTGVCLFTMHLARDPFTAVAWTRQGRCVLLGNQRGTLSLLDLASGNATISTAFSSPITKIAYAPNHRVERFFVVTESLVHIFTGGYAHPCTRRYATPILDAAWCPAGRALAVLTQHGQVDVWDVTARRSRFQALFQQARCLAWGETDQMLTIGTAQGGVQEYCFTQQRWNREYAVSRFPLAVLCRGEFGMIAQSARETVFWANQTFHALTPQVQAVAIDPCGTTLATALAQHIDVLPLPSFLP